MFFFCNTQLSQYNINYTLQFYNKSFVVLKPVTTLTESIVTSNCYCNLLNKIKKKQISDDDSRYVILKYVSYYQLKNISVLSKSVNLLINDYR